VGSDAYKVQDAAVAAIELMSRHDEARELLAHNEGIMMALARAYYDDEGSLKEPMMRRSVAGSYMGDSRDGEGDDSSDDESMQLRRIQVALKNLVSAT